MVEVRGKRDLEQGEELALEGTHEATQKNVTKSIKPDIKRSIQIELLKRKREYPFTEPQEI